jgi:hypothetical protein
VSSWRTEEFRLASSPLVFAPGVIKWAKNFWNVGDKHDKKFIKSIISATWSLGEYEVIGLLSGDFPSKTIDDTVVFTATYFDK